MEMAGVEPAILGFWRFRVSVIPYQIRTYVTAGTALKTRYK
jgi:hypothetical protein